MPDSITMIPVAPGDAGFAGAVAVRDATGQSGDGYRVTVLDTGAPAAQRAAAWNVRLVDDPAAIAVQVISGGFGGAFWLDSALDRRLILSATNTQAADVQDALLTATIPDATPLDATSLRVVELTALDTIDRAYDWRYASGQPSLNHLPILPVRVQGQTLTIKALGRWQVGELRRFAVYWTQGGGAAAPTWPHLDAIAPAWSAVAVAGTAGDTYTLNIAGSTVSYTMQAGDTATIIATALRTAINSGGVATATGSTGTITIVATNPRNLTFTVTATGTTVPANLTVTKPVYFSLARVGPDTALFAPANFPIGLPYGTTAGGVVASRVAFGRSTNQAVRVLAYKVNGDATTYGTTDATVTSLSLTGPTIEAAGQITCTQRASGVDWAGAYTATMQQRVVVGRKSDNTAPNSLNKYVDLLRVQLTLTCQRAHTPVAVAANATTVGGYDVLTFGSLDNTFGGNSTEAIGNQLANFSQQAGGAITSYAASANLTALPVVDTIIGTHGNTNASGILITAFSLTGWGSQSPQAVWMSQGNAYGVLGLRNLITGATIPQGATITIDFWYVNAKTLSATTIGDTLLPDELVTLMRSLATPPSVTVATAESYRAGLALTFAQAGTRAVAGVQWFQTNASAKTGRVNNYGYQYQVKTGAVGMVDDEDANYGAAHALHGLCLRYRRTRDATLIPLIENQVAFHLALEQAAVTAYGTWWQGSAPYFFWPKATGSGSAYPYEAAVPPSAGATVFDPAVGTFQTIDYTQGQVRRSTSIDQMHMVAHGLYAYLYLLRNEAAITANTTLRADALAYVQRMRDFEAIIVPAASRAIGNLYAVLTNATPTNTNGITDSYENPISGVTLPNPYYGQQFGTWQVANGTAVVINPSANSTLDAFFASVYAPNTDPVGVRRYLRGRCMDMLMADYGYHDQTRGASNAANGVIGPYPTGWSQRAALSGDTATYATPRTAPSNNGYSSDLHTITVNDGGGRDHLSGRAAQRLIVLCLLALLDPTATVPIEMNGATVLRSVPILTAVDRAAATLALYGSEPTTQAQRLAVSGALGRGSYDPQIIDSAFTGYWLMALELWQLVQQRTAGAFDPATYYRIAGA